jgi:NAD(P)-dependent dehydrogenase (short-subunit alcohol dehydrogenase family)
MTPVAYGSAKTGILGVRLTAAKELAQFGVTVNAIAPSARTRMLDAVPAKSMHESEQSIPLGRVGEPETSSMSLSELQPKMNPTRGYSRRAVRHVVARYQWPSPNVLEESVRV